MRSFFLILLVIPFCYQALSQDFILDKRSKIKRKLDRYYQENNRRCTVTENDSSLTYVLHDSLSLPATYVYYFNENNRCIKQETIYSCDSCLQKGISYSLASKFVNWVKTGPESYYAKFPYNTLMEPIRENGRFILRYTRMKRNEAGN